MLWVNRANRHTINPKGQSAVEQFRDIHQPGTRDKSTTRNIHSNDATNFIDSPGLAWEKTYELLFQQRCAIEAHFWQSAFTVWLLAEKDIWRYAWRHDLPPALSFLLEINCIKLFDCIGQQIIKLDRISWITKVEFRLCLHAAAIQCLSTETSLRDIQIHGLRKIIARNQINVKLKFCYSWGWERQVRYTNIRVIEGRYLGDNLNTVE